MLALGRGAISPTSICALAVLTAMLTACRTVPPSASSAPDRGPVPGLRETEAQPTLGPEEVPRANPPEAASAPPAAEYLITTTGGLRLRKGPGVEHAVVIALLEGEEVVSIERGPETRIGDKVGRWVKVRSIDDHEGWAFGAHLAPSPRTGRVGAATTRAARSRERSRFLPVDTRTLGELFKRRGFRPPKTFKAWVVLVEGDADNGFVYRPFDYAGTSTDRTNWWPASSVKVFPAVAAMERVRAWGMDVHANVTFHYDGGDRTLPLSQLVQRAVGPSDNLAFDRLVEIAGAEYLNGSFFSAAHGLPDTVLLRSYKHRVKAPSERGEGSNRHSPRITLRQGKSTKVVDERNDTKRRGASGCHGVDRSNRHRAASAGAEGNCTTLRDLTEIIRRVVMHDLIPPAERFDLGIYEREVLIETLRSQRSRGNGVSDPLVEAFRGRPAVAYHKAGYAGKWFSDAVLLHLEDTDERFIVGMANYPGRGACDEGAAHVAAILASGALKNMREPAQPTPSSKTPTPAPASPDAAPSLAR